MIVEVSVEKGFPKSDFTRKSFKYRKRQKRPQPTGPVLKHTNLTPSSHADYTRVFTHIKLTAIDVLSSQKQYVTNQYDIRYIQTLLGTVLWKCIPSMPMKVSRRVLRQACLSCWVSQRLHPLKLQFAMPLR